MTENGEFIIALAGNPNVGKSTLFNYITGLKQHTGNWTGKTVDNAYGYCMRGKKSFVMVDLPGTYSLLPHSKEEEVARDFICFENPDATVIVLDATTIERNLNLALQVLEVTNRVVLCINLIDEAKRKGITVDCAELSDIFGVPVIATNALTGEGVNSLLDALCSVTELDTSPGRLHIPYPKYIEFEVERLYAHTHSRWAALKLLENDPDTVESIRRNGLADLQDAALQQSLAAARAELQEHGISEKDFKDKEVEAYFTLCEDVATRTVTYKNKEYNLKDRKIDRLLTSKSTGIPIMILFLALILWITIVGANYPSQFLSWLLFGLQDKLSAAITSLGAPGWLHNVTVLGMYRTLAWVISVMLPPMAIFFPLFTLLEDLGYLPRIAFNLDKCFCRAHAHGKQALTMCMGLGCNAVGVEGCRIIDSPRERLIAILTNNFVPCNGRFPTIITLSTVFIGGGVAVWLQSAVSALSVMFVILLGVAITLVVSRILSGTLLRGYPSSFVLELPPYRRPKVCSVLVRSLLDRTLFVLGRAVSVAAPAGIVIWLFANVTIGGASLLSHCVGFLDPFARLMGLDGNILLAFLLGMPANEIVLPIIVMSYLAGGSLMELNNLGALFDLFTQNGWTLLTAVNVILFSLMHFPCATTLLTIRKETKSWRWTGLAFLIPTLCGVTACMLTTLTVRLFQLFF